MNAGLNREQIEYIQSVVGKTDYNYERDEDEYSEEEWNKLTIDYHELSKISDTYWVELVLLQKSVKAQLVENEERYQMFEQVSKIGKRYFMTYYYIIFNEQNSLEDLNLEEEREVNEVYPVERLVIDFVYDLNKLSFGVRPYIGEIQ